jgi:proteic killer suppression protein
VILSFGDKRTAEFASGDRVKALEAIERPTRMKLDRLEAATALGDLAALPGNRLESLAGDRKGQWSIRVNDRWRICFAWPRAVVAPRRLRSWTITRRDYEHPGHTSR